jgi:pyrroloquinoline quinone (PQQ) biosynthesis protein C
MKNVGSLQSVFIMLPHSIVMNNETHIERDYYLKNLSEKYITQVEASHIKSFKRKNDAVIVSQENQ